MKLDLGSLSRVFTIRCSEGFAENFGPRLIARAGAEGAGVRLWFLAKPDKDSTPLRDGTVDLETGVTGESMGPEIRTLGLFRDRFVGVVRKSHPHLERKVSAQQYASGAHVLIVRQGLQMSPIDAALARLGLTRNVAVTVSGFSPAIALARASDLVATVPERHTAALCRGMHRFILPMPVAGFTISLFWHPRLDARVTITKAGNMLICRLQHHPELTGYMEYMDNNEFRLTYSNIGYGVHAVKFSLRDGKPVGIEIKVNDFVEYDSYLFVKDPQGIMIK